MRKKSTRKAASNFRKKVDSINAFLVVASVNQSKEHVSWLHEHAVIRLYRDFEELILNALVGAINHDTSTLAACTGIPFPKHLTDEVCEYLVIGDGFFDFKGRDGLIATLKRFVPDTHYLIDIAKNPKYKSALEQLAALRNLAAHESTVARTRAKDVLGYKKLGSAGSWLKRQGRFQKIASLLKDFATDLAARSSH